MAKTVRTETLTPHQVIMSERFANGLPGDHRDSRTHVGYDDFYGPFEGGESRKGAQFLVLKSVTLRDDGICGGMDWPTWAVEAVRLTDGKLLPGAEVIYFTAGGETNIRQVELVGEASDITVEITPAE